MKTPLFIRAKFFFNEAGKTEEDQGIYVTDGIVRKISPFSLLKKEIFEKPLEIDGILFPGFVNSHLHLELSFFKNRIPRFLGFANWVRTLLREREKASKKEIEEAIYKEIENLENSETEGLIDISNSEKIASFLKQSRLKGFILKEILAFSSQKFDLSFEKIKSNLFLSPTPHALYTVHPKVLILIKDFCKKRQLPFSLHFAESEEELEFLTSLKGKLFDLLLEKGHDKFLKEVSFFYKKPPLEILKNLGLLDKKTLLVHCTFLSKKDFEEIKKNGASVCICPRSNYYIQEKLPEIPGILKTGVNLLLGTDSLASNEDLSLLKEIQFIKNFYPQVSALELFKMVTLNARKFLHLEGIGIIREGESLNGVILSGSFRNFSPCREDTFLTDILFNLSDFKVIKLKNLIIKEKCFF